MTHMHIPDGILPLWLWISGFLAAAVLLAVVLFRLRNMDRKRQIPLLGAMAAAMLVSMSIEILPLAYHVNLSVVAGILLGPSLGFVAAFIVNLMLALLGHGGITVIGLNSLILGAEAALGHVFFFFLPRRMPVFWRAAAATFCALLAASVLLIAVVGASQSDADVFLHSHDRDGISEEKAHPSLTTFAVMVLTLGAGGWALESALTGAVIRFISQVKPDLLAHVLHAGRKQERGG